MKATKNAGELKGMRACHLRDGAAESEFLAWLEEELQKQHNTPQTSVPAAKTQQSKGVGFGKKSDSASASSTDSNTIASSSSSITEVNLLFI